MAGYDILDPSSVEPLRSKTSGMLHVDLTEQLHLTETRSKIWYLSPGESLSHHRQTEQEELYFMVSGQGQMRIEDLHVDVPEGGLVRVSPEVRRQVRNDTDEQHTWLIIGAPPKNGDGRPIADDS